MRSVYRLIRRIGIHRKYNGYYFLAEAVRLSNADQEEPLRVTNDIYPKIAEKYRTSSQGVERSIRTVSEIAWRSNREFLEEIAGRELEKRPTNSELIDILAFYQQNKEES